MSGSAGDDGPGVLSGLVDLTEVDLADIAGLAEPDTALGHSLRRLLADAARPGESLAGFQSSF